MSLSTLSKAAEMDLAHLSRIETSTSTPRRDTVERLIRAFCRQAEVDEERCRRIRQALMDSAGYRSAEEGVLDDLARRAGAKLRAAVGSITTEEVQRLVIQMSLDTMRRLLNEEDPRSIEALKDLLPEEGARQDNDDLGMDNTKAVIVGIDCATDPRNVGIAVSRFRKGRLHLESVTTGAGAGDQSRWIADRLADADRALIALDAPLGWPRPLSQELVEHRAGALLTADANAMFRRHTDVEIKRRVRKQPLDVGADRIARTAVTALSLLEEIRKATHEAVELAWAPSFEDRIAAIEVYPAATLKMLGLRSGQYKKKTDRESRTEIAEGLAEHIDGLSEVPSVLDNADILDAVVCAVAGADFLQDRAVGPDSTHLVKREGWIWVR